MDKIRSVVVISDTHCGCKLGLCPPEVMLDEGGTYHHSPLQAKVWAYWIDFWENWVPRVTKGEPYVIVHNGDTIDGVHHQSVTQISQNLTDQKRIAEEVLRPRISGAALVNGGPGYYHIRGTEAHVGKSGQDEEEVAKTLGAIPDENGNHARWDLWLRLDGALIHFCHHIGTTSSAAYESTAVWKEMVEAYNEAGRSGEEPPDVVVRSHRHRHFKTEVSTNKGNGISLVTPGWQLKTPFVWRGALGRTGTPEIGGCVIRAGSEGEDNVYTRFKVWKIQRTPPVCL